jgi:PKD domain
MKTFPICVSAVPAVTLILVLSGCSRDTPEPAKAPIASGAVPPIVVRPPATSKETASAEAETAPAGVKVAAQCAEDSGEVPLTVHLESEVRDGSGTPPYSYLWDFGDGSPFATTNNVEHVYKIPGYFRAHIIVTDKTGATSMDYIDVDVEREGEDPAGSRLTPLEAFAILKKAQEERAAAGSAGQDKEP